MRVVGYVCKAAQGPLRGFLAQVQLAPIGLNAFRPLNKVIVSKKPVGNGPRLALMPKCCHGSGAGQAQQPPRVHTTCAGWVLLLRTVPLLPHHRWPPQGPRLQGMGNIKGLWGVLYHSHC